MTREGTLEEKGKQNIVDSDGDQILQAMLAWIAAHPACEGGDQRARTLTRTPALSNGRRHP